MRQATKLHLSQLPGGGSLVAVTRAGTSCGRRALFEQFKRFLFVVPALISKSCLILTSDLFLTSSFCRRQTLAASSAAASHLQHVSSASQLSSLQVSTGWFLPHPTPASGFCAVSQPPCGFPPSGLWLCAMRHADSHKLSQSPNEDQ